MYACMYVYTYICIHAYAYICLGFFSHCVTQRIFFSYFFVKEGHKGRKSVVCDVDICMSRFKETCTCENHTPVCAVVE